MIHGGLLAEDSDTAHGSPEETPHHPACSALTPDTFRPAAGLTLRAPDPVAVSTGTSSPLGVISTTARRIKAKEW